MGKAIVMSLSVFAVCTLSFPQKIESIDYRPILQPVAIRLNPFSLAYAALEDEHLEEQARNKAPVHAVRLTSGQRFSLALLKPKEKPQVANDQGPVLVVPEIDDTPSVRIFKPLVISKYDVNVVKLLPVALPGDIVPGTRLASTRPTPVEESVAEPTESIIIPAPVARHYEDNSEHHTFDDLSYEQLANHLIHKELAWREQQADPHLRTRLRDARKEKILVASAAAPGQKPIPAPPVFVAKARTTPEPSNDNAMQVASSNDLVDHTEQESQSQPRVSLQGTIEFVDGLALTSSNQTVVVHHTMEGVAHESAEVSLQKGQFSIAVGDRQGELTAKLIDGLGDVVGMGQVSIDQNQTYHIQMRPVDGVTGQVISAHSFGRSPLAVPSAYVTVDSTSSEMMTMGDGKFEDGNVLPGSTYVIRVEKNGFWGALAVGGLEPKLQLPLFPTTMVTALLKEGAASNLDLAERQGIIWGRVTRSGQPVAGAQVALGGVAPSRPIFFPFGQLLIPDLKQVVTGPNGYFAFLQVSPGLHSVQVGVTGHQAIVQAVPVDTHAVSLLNFDVSEERKVRVDVTDAFHFDYKIPAVVRWQESERELQFDPHEKSPQKLSYPHGSGLLCLDIDAGPRYLPTRQSFSRATNILHATPVDAAWAQRIASQAGVRIDPRQGLVFGLTEGPGFEAFMDESVPSSLLNRVYFNANGELTSTGVPSGGFLFFNVPPGARTIGLQAQGSQRYATRLVAVESGLASVIHFQFPNP